LIIALKLVLTPALIAIATSRSAKKGRKWSGPVQKIGRALLVRALPPPR